MKCKLQILCLKAGAAVMEIDGGGKKITFLLILDQHICNFIYSTSLLCCDKVLIYP